MSLIKSNYGVTHGYANTISLFFRQKAEGGPPTHAELIADQYMKKMHFKPIYDRLVAEA